MIVRIFTGPTWATAFPYGDYDFDEVPRIDEALAIGEGDSWTVGRVVDVAHRLADGGTADVALLLAPPRQGRRGEEDVPATLLDVTVNLGEDGAADQRIVRSGPWG